MAESSATEQEEQAGPSDELLEWASGMTCEACHSDQADSAEDEKCAFSVHAAMEIDCVTCHADDKLIDIHDKAKPDAKLPTKLKKSEFSVEACTTCHDPEALIEKTADSTALVDSEGTTVNPHEIPAVKDHAKIDCGSCHMMHGTISPVSKAPTLCQDCHHEDVYECYTCHS